MLAVKEMAKEALTPSKVCFDKPLYFKIAHRRNETMCVV